MSATLYRRGEAVRVRLDGEGSALRKARVLIDLGGETLIVGQQKPKTTRRVKREAVQPEKRPRVPDLKIDPAALHCVEIDGQWCALSRQASPPTRKEMAEGVSTMCSKWISARCAPTQTEPTCQTCREWLKLDA